MKKEEVYQSSLSLWGNGIFCILMNVLIESDKEMSTLEYLRG